MKSGTILKTSVDFDNSLFFALPVSIWQEDRVIHDGVIIEEHDGISVKISKYYYLKSRYTFQLK